MDLEYRNGHPAQAARSVQARDAECLNDSLEQADRAIDEQDVPDSQQCLDWQGIREERKKPPKGDSW